MTSFRILLLFLTFLSVIMYITGQYIEEEEESESDESEGEEEEEEFTEKLKKLLDIFGSAINETLRPHFNCSSEAAIDMENCAVEFANTFAFEENDVTEKDLCRIGKNFLHCFDVGFGRCNSVNILAARTKYRQDVVEAVQPEPETTLIYSSTTDMTHTLNSDSSTKTMVKPKNATSRAGQINVYGMKSISPSASSPSFHSYSLFIAVDSYLSFLFYLFNCYFFNL